MAVAHAFKSGTPLRAGCRRAQPVRSGRRLSVAVNAEKVLIVNTKKGGHSFIGLHLAKQLMAKGHSVTIMNDGDPSIEAKAPFSQYSSLAANGATIMYGAPADPSTYPAGHFDVVYDNNGKSMEECQPLIDTYASQVKHYVFVGSAGAYAANPVEPMHVEGDERKAKAGHVQVEQYLERSRAPFTVFQPMYIYGPHTGKDCEQWFIDRIIRDRPVPIPAPGIQLTSISHVEDLASMMAAVPGCAAAVGQHYNTSGDRCYTLDGIAKMVAAALGKEANIVHYDVSNFDIPKGKGFPFRTVHFFASTDKAKAELGWTPKHKLSDDLPELIAAYKAAGRQHKDIDFSVDDMILAGL